MDTTHDDHADGPPMEVTIPTGLGLVSTGKRLTVSRFPVPGYLALTTTHPGSPDQTGVVRTADVVRALRALGITPDPPTDVVVREADLPEVTWNAAARAWSAGGSLLAPSLNPTGAALDRQARRALANLALVRHARAHEPPRQCVSQWETPRGVVLGCTLPVGHDGPHARQKHSAGSPA